MASYSALPTVALHMHADYFHSDKLPEVLHMEDAAMLAMLDLKKTKILTINQSASIVDAQIEMNVASVHMLFVIDEEDKVVGLISSQDILGAKPLKFIQERKVTRESIKVRAIMLPADKIVAINKEQLALAKVGHIIETMRNARQSYAFVIEMNDNKQFIVGIFSLSTIGKQLDKNITDYDLFARSLAELHEKI